jgi:thiamine biosynthesis lipoprotein
VNDTIYHHILNTQTGKPCSNDLVSVTILSESSVDGDALSTACFALGLEDGQALIDSLENIEAIFLTKDYKIIDTRK